jgi:CheY-like chemotaxis protein
VFSQPQPPSPSAKTVLIVEDDPDLRRIFSDVLFWAGFRVEQASDGVTALKMIESNPPDLLILDIGLPMLDGLSVRDELAAHAETRHIPVVVVTGIPDDFRQRLRDDPVLRKPVTPEKLLATIREYLTGV